MKIVIVNYKTVTMKRNFDTFETKSADDDTKKGGFVFEGFNPGKQRFSFGGPFMTSTNTTPVPSVSFGAPSTSFGAPSTSDKTIRKKRKKLTSLQRDKYWKYWYGDVDTAVCICCQERRLRRNLLRGWSLGHDIAFSIGGSDHPENVIPICKQCNDEMGNDYTVIAYHIAYQEKNDIFRSNANEDWFIKAFDPTKVKTVSDLRQAYHECGAFDKRVGDFLTKDFYKTFTVTYKGRVLKEDELLPQDTFSDDFLAEISP